MSLTSDLTHLVEEFLYRQPHQITCLECGKKLTVTSKTDYDDDLIIIVEPCQTCLDTATGDAEDDTRYSLEREVENLQKVIDQLHQEIAELTAELTSRH